ncbi:MAG TPA: helix-turn-helix transcriptional regulator [Pseudonocardia sp.]|jgi:AraC-like DNA-binding protein|nr:helix-turn-helix transcriptional regulator [Pseudonocardia sp.]
MLESRQLSEADRAANRVLPHNEHFPVHRHTRAHLVYAASGALTVTTPRGTAIAPTNRAAWTPAGVDHQHRAYGHTDMRILYVPHPYAEALPADPVVLAISPLVREVILALTGPREYPPEDWDRMRDVVLAELAREPEQPLHLPEPVDPRLRAATDLLHADPASTSTLAQLGQAIGAGERTLSRLFHTELGMSFRQWRTQLRIQRSLILLAEGRTVLDTATACGWSNPSTFIDAFTALLGETPSRYRSRPVG